MSSQQTGRGLDDPRNPYASSNRWRHQESSAFARHAAAQAHQQPRDASAASTADTAQLANFLNKDRVEGDGPAGPHQQIVTGVDDHTQPHLSDGHGKPPTTDGKEIVSGPLLNYRGVNHGRWRGSVLIVVKGGGSTPPPGPTLVLRRAGAVDRQKFVAMSGADNVESQLSDQANGVNGAEATEEISIPASCLYSDPRNTFWAFDIEVDYEASEVKWEYIIPDMRYSSSEKPQTNSFFVPAIGESMRIMFHSCNGFSVGTDEEAWSGPALWNDVMRRHKEAPFHVM